MHWSNSFLPAILGIVPIVLCFIWLKEPELNEVVVDVAASAPEKDEKLNPRSWLYAVILFIVALVNMTWSIAMSELMGEKGVAVASQIAMVLAGCKVGAVIGGTLFPRIAKCGNGAKKVAMIITLCGVISNVLVLLTGNTAILLLAGILSGTGQLMCVVMCNTFAGMSNKRSKVTLATTLVMAGMSVAMFVAGYYISFSEKLFGGIAATPTSSAYIASAIVMAILFVLSLFVDISHRPAE